MNFPVVTDFANAKQYADAVQLPFDTGRDLETGQIYVANDARFTQGTFNQPLTDFAVGGWSNTGMDAELNAYVGAPIRTSKRFNYKAWTNAEALLSETTDDLRAIGGDFKAVNLTSTEVNAATQNRGLVMILDKDEVQEGVITEQMAVGYLMNRIKLNQIRRASALLIAAATDQARTWLTGTRDADMDTLTEVHDYHTATGIWPNTLVYGRTAWLGRQTTMRALTSAGGFASAEWTESQIASFLGVDTVARVKAAYQSAAATKTVIGATKIIVFYRSTSAMREDPSNLKYFWSPTESGGPVAAFRYEEGRKRSLLELSTTNCCLSPIPVAFRL